MKYHVILNGCSNGYENQARELNGFVKKHFNDSIEGDSVIICTAESDKELLKKLAPTNNVIFFLVSYYQPEIILYELERHMNTEDIYCFGSDFCANELAVRIAVRMDGSSMIGVNQAILTDIGLSVGKNVYSNHMQGEFLMRKAPYCIAIAKGIGLYDLESINPRVVEEVDLYQNESEFVISHQLEKEIQAEGIKDAKLIIAAGRGVKNKAAVEELQRIAEKLHGELGVSRPVAMNAWTPMNRLIGVSGAMLRPQISITAGVSGAAAFHAGIEKSDFIVAINTDEKAPIMKKADVVIVDDYKEIMKELVSCMSEDETKGCV